MYISLVLQILNLTTTINLSHNIVSAETSVVGRMKIRTGAVLTVVKGMPIMTSGKWLCMFVVDGSIFCLFTE